MSYEEKMWEQALSLGPQFRPWRLSMPETSVSPTRLHNPSSLSEQSELWIFQGLFVNHLTTLYQPHRLCGSKWRVGVDKLWRIWQEVLVADYKELSINYRNWGRTGGFSVIIAGLKATNLSNPRPRQYGSAVPTTAPRRTVLLYETWLERGRASIYIYIYIYIYSVTCRHISR
jgi:hypothetical protein